MERGRDRLFPLCLVCSDSSGENAKCCRCSDQFSAAAFLALSEHGRDIALKLLIQTRVMDTVG